MTHRKINSAPSRSVMARGARGIGSRSTPAHVADDRLDDDASDLAIELLERRFQRLAVVEEVPA